MVIIFNSMTGNYSITNNVINKYYSLPFLKDTYTEQLLFLYIRKKFLKQFLECSWNAFQFLFMNVNAFVLKIRNCEWDCIIFLKG